MSTTDPRTCSICHGPFASWHELCGWYWCWTCDGHMIACRVRGSTTHDHCRCVTV